ncbi:LysM peptidoglycan-binding domain-containing protein [Bibersteinia trehalosi]|uniref:LysM domain-containing protein n=2 Tax=Bibersteinia trehalosi TaxID=47735 RepID=A0A179CW74_BIBTR|nr:LysM peptidoglycan-binding domain-containing protein [Bibersteinia trehalosi]OAQ14145.1 hypothetical protein F480_07060 [Bibersteinia trehalosi Y31]RRN01768.1 LysM peptidoglycan-binding domain-containing protein [Bibersteinia trehalosi]TCT13756.1 lipoprotein NlpD [Bibersteinia trehalosi]
MKKSLFLLSFIAIAITGCTNNTSSETTNAEITDASTAWQTEVQPTQMPASMGQPTYQAPTYSAPQPVATSYGSNTFNTEVVGSCQVVRDGANKPIYSQITKGCYSDSSYTVGQFDTLYLIGYLTGTSAEQIAALNNISTTTKLKVGSVLRVR